MFWGLIIEPGKRYSQNVDDSFHVSKATLDLSQASDEDVTLMLDHEGQEFILCHLNKSNKQESLDLNFQMGDSISFFTQGQAAIHLSGYHFSEDEDDMTLGDMMEEEEEEEDDEEGVEEEQIADLREAIRAKAMKRPQPTNGKNAKPGKVAKMEVEDDSDEDDEEEEGEEEEEEKPAPPPKSKKQQKKEAAEKKAQQQQGNNNNVQQQQQKKNQPQQPAAGGPDAKPKKQTLPGGLVVEDIKVGSGPAAKQGDQVAVYYQGRLQKNNKMFDKCVSGKGFTFKLGAGRVIKGWDLGVAGMQIGGKRKLTIPAPLAYGAGGSPPQIPPNSTLVFEVELKGVN